MRELRMISFHFIPIGAGVEGIVIRSLGVAKNDWYCNGTSQKNNNNVQNDPIGVIVTPVVVVLLCSC